VFTSTKTYIQEDEKKGRKKKKLLAPIRNAVQETFKEAVQRWLQQLASSRV
jgi:hypothetical protein